MRLLLIAIFGSICLWIALWFGLSLALHREGLVNKLLYVFIILAVLFGCVALAFGEEEINWNKLVSAMIKIESNGNPNAIGDNGNSIGLCQISKIVLKEYNEIENPKVVYRNGRIFIMGKNENIVTNFKKDCVESMAIELFQEDLYCEGINKHICLWYLKRLKNHYGCKTIEQICSAYNGGITRLRRNKFDISKMPKSTQYYVKKVMAIYEK